jgi:uncharacterized protein
MGVLGVRVRVSEPEHDVLVVLSEAEGELSLPIVIGPHEGVAIATAQAGVRSPRPGPHDLLLSTVRALGASLEYVTICALQEGTFIAELVLSNGTRVDSRASDAIALALRAGVEVWCADDVLDAAAVVLAAEEQGEGDEDPAEVPLSEDAAPTEEAVEQFRQFLDEVEPSDFDERGGGR